MTADERKARVLATRGLHAKIAREVPVSPGHLSLVLSGHRRATPRVKRAIAKALRLPVREVFPPQTTTTTDAAA